MPRMEAAVATATFFPFRAGFFVTFAEAAFLAAVFFAAFLTVFFEFFFFAATGDSVFRSDFQLFSCKRVGECSKSYLDCH